MTTGERSCAAIPLVLMMTFALACAAPARAETANAALPVVDAIEGTVAGDCRALAAHLEEQNRKLGQELRQIKREIAVLNQNLERPGIREIMAGIGYILGLFGMAAFFAARRRRDRAPRGE